MYNYVYADTLKRYSEQNFDDNIDIDIYVNGMDYPGLKSFITNISQNVLPELNTFGYVNCSPIWGGIDETNSTNEIILNIYPHLFSSQIFLRTDTSFYNAILTIENVFGQIIKEIKNISSQTLKLHRNNLPGGLYFVCMTDTRQQSSCAKQTRNCLLICMDDKKSTDNNRGGVSCSFSYWRNVFISYFCFV